MIRHIADQMKKPPDFGGRGYFHWGSWQRCMSDLGLFWVATADACTIAAAVGTPTVTLFGPR
jgi:hypothetical protein